MRISFRSSIFLFCSSLFAFCSFSQSISPRPDAARPFGMGNGFSAVANDLNTILFNPAGLGTIKQIEISALAGRFLGSNAPPQSELHALGTFPFQSYKESWNYGVFGFLLHRAGKPGDGAVTNVGFSLGKNLKQMVPKRLAVLRVPEGLHAGFSVRGRELGRSSPDGANTQFGLGLDLGFLYQFEESKDPLKSGWSAAFVIQEINSKAIASAVAYRLGVAWRNQQTVLSLDLAIQEKHAKFFPGLEISFLKKLLLLRIGSGDVPGQARQIALGLGVLLPPIQMDLAYGFPTGSYSNSNDRILLSFTYRFGSPRLSQYLRETDLEKVSELENKVVNLESQKATLHSAIREQKNLYETIAADMRQARVKSAEAEKRLKELDEKIRQRNKEMEKAEGEIQKLQTKIEKDGKENREVQPPGSLRGARKHKVAAGDSLRGLAQKYYGNPDKWKLLYDANQDKIIRGVPKEGEELTIP